MLVQKKEQKKLIDDMKSARNELENQMKVVKFAERDKKANKLTRQESY